MTRSVEETLEDPNECYARCGKCGGEKDAEGWCANYCTADDPDFHHGQIDFVPNERDPQDSTEVHAEARRQADEEDAEAIAEAWDALDHEGYVRCVNE